MLILLFVAVPVCFAQGVTTNEDCPAVVVVSPITNLKDGDTAIFATVVSGKFDAKKISYKWSLDNGQIVSGQDRDEITITVAGKPTVTVEVGGLDSDCNGKASASALYGDIKVSPQLFDEFGKVKESLLQLRIGALVNTLRRNPTAIGYIINYGSADAIKKRETDVVKLMNEAPHNEIDPLRVVFVNGGEEKDVRTRVWISPPGADTSNLN